MQGIKKLTLVISSLTGGGAEGICVNIANSFADNGWKVDLVVLNLNEEVNVDRISKKVNLVVLKVNHARFSFIPLIKYLYKNKIKTILVFNHELTVILVILRYLLRLNIKIISRNISVLSIKINQLEKNFFWKKYIIKSLVKFFYHKLDHVINQCHSMRDDLIKVFPQLINKSSVINNPISIHIQDYIRKNDLTKIQKENYLLCVGRLEQVKAFHYAIEGFAGISSKFPELRLKIVGKGSLEKKLKKKAYDCSVIDRVDFEGFQKNIIPYYLYAKGTILTSSYEGYPNVLLESISMNTPVIAFDCPGGTKEIIQNKFNGYLVNNEDVDDLTEKLSNLLLKKLKYEDLKKTVEKNQIENVIKKYEKLVISFL